MGNRVVKSVSSKSVTTVSTVTLQSPLTGKDAEGTT
jgi:hypothetical protein